MKIGKFFLNIINSTILWVYFCRFRRSLGIWYLHAKMLRI